MEKLISFLTRIPLEKLLLLLGVPLIVLSFADISLNAKQWSFSFTRKPNLVFIIIGASLLLVFLAMLLRKERTHYISKAIENGRRLQIGTNFIVDVVIGSIQDVKLPDEYSAIVLPANTAFDDACIHDNRSALGAFFTTHFPKALIELQNLIRTEACRIQNVTMDRFVGASPGTTVLLDHPHGTSYRIFVTAVSVIQSSGIIKADTLSLIASIKQIVKLASEKRISNLYLPVIGTGHGGLEFSSTLVLLILQMIHCVRYEDGHLLKKVVIVVHDSGKKRKAEIESLVEAANSIIMRR